MAIAQEQLTAVCGCIADEGSFVNLQHKHNFTMAHFGMMLGMMCQSLQGTHHFCCVMSNLLDVPCHHTILPLCLLGQCGQRATWGMHGSAWGLTKGQHGVIHGNHLQDGDERAHVLLACFCVSFRSIYNDLLQPLCICCTYFTMQQCIKASHTCTLQPVAYVGMCCGCRPRERFSKVDVLEDAHG